MSRKHTYQRPLAMTLRALVACALVLSCAMPSQPARAQDQAAEPAGQTAPDDSSAEQATPDAPPVAQAAPAEQAASGDASAAQAPAESTSPAKELVAAAALAPATDVAPQASRIDEILAGLPLKERIAQMIMPCFRTWNGVDVTELNEELAAALRSHQYGGVLLYGSNVKGAEQTARLISALQQNNAQIADVAHVPYLLPVDEEGGIVTRLSMGTRMNGSMAVGATGDEALANAISTGGVIGSELAALGFNADFAPDADVNNNPLNPVIGTRSFSDDPAKVAELAPAFARGLARSNVVGTFKHFPGHGDTAADTHIASGVAVDKTIDELRSCELVPFKAAIDGGADLIMTAHITLPKYDDEVTFGDGVTRGYFPATMSPKIMGELLRGELGYQGVIVTDALEMDAVSKAGLVPGEQGSVEYAANVAEKVIGAGVDILLLPRDLTNEDAATFYDEYIDAIAAKVEAGTVSEDRINESVRRILTLKDKYGILDADTSGDNIDQVVERAKAVVGSDENHATERGIARQAVTLLKNDDLTLPASGHHGRRVLLGRVPADCVAIQSAVDDLIARGVVAENAHAVNRATGQESGDADSPVSIVIDYYYDPEAGASRVDGELAEEIRGADTTLAMTSTSGVGTLQDDSPLCQGVMSAMAIAHEAGGKFVLLSGNLPYDAARYQDSDAILLAYMSAGTGVDPTDRSAGNAGAFNANIAAAIGAVFDDVQPSGKLPVQIPRMVQGDDGSWSFDTASTLYERGFGLGFDYVVTEGAGQTYQVGSGLAAVFEANARHDLLSSVMVDGSGIAADDYSVTTGSTVLSLHDDYLDTLDAGEHSLTLSYDYPSGAVDVSTTFTVERSSASMPSDNRGSSDMPKTSDPTLDVLPILFAALVLIAVGGAVYVIRRKRQ